MLNPRLISGITVTLYEKTAAGTDAFNRTVYTETPVQVPNVLVQPQERTTDVPTESTDITGEKTSYILGIPKGDAHEWKNRRVAFFGHTFVTESGEWQGIDALIPGDWNKKILCRRYDDG